MRGFAPGDSLELAQGRKIDELLDATGVGLGTHLLEVGTGWGALAVRAAGRVVAPRSPPSPSPTSRPRWRVSAPARAGVSSRVDVQLRNYR